MSSHTLSPIKPGGELTKETTITINGEEVKMVVDIDLNGNTGKPKFTTKQPDKLRNFIGSLTSDFSAFPRETHLIDKPVSKELEKAIIEDKDGVVKDAYEKIINDTKEEITENGGDAEVFTEKILDNKNNTLEGALENSFREDINEDGIVGGIAEENNNEPEEFKAPQVKNEHLVYPEDMLKGDGSESQDYIYIEQFSYLPPNPTTGDRLTDRGRKMNGETEAMNTVDQVIAFGVRRSNNIKEPFGSCTLPIPNKLGVSNGVSWGEARANSVELAGFTSANNTIRDQLKKFDVTELARKGVKGAGNTLNELKEDIQNPDPNNPDAGSILSATLAKAVLSQLNINVDIDQFITRQTGAAINPNLELLFGGPQLRTFSFAFDFAPNSPTEAEIVRKIQRWFKQGMLPSRSGATGARPQSLFLGSPNVFRIAYMNKSRRIKGLNIIKICALTSCQIDFTPDNTYQSYDDSKAFSQPVRSTMALTFNELTPIFRDDYAAERTGFVRDPSLEDLGTNITGEQNSISDSDIGF